MSYTGGAGCRQLWQSQSQTSPERDPPPPYCLEYGNMTKSPTGIIPAEYNTAKQLPDVIAFLKSCPMPYEDKRELLFGWARNVGLRLNAANYLVLHS